MDTLSEIADRVRSCKDCALSMGRTNAVPGEGACRRGGDVHRRRSRGSRRTARDAPSSARLVSSWTSCWPTWE